jgi:hypothetical protein
VGVGGVVSSRGVPALVLAMLLAFVRLSVLQSRVLRVLVAAVRVGRVGSNKHFSDVLANVRDGPLLLLLLGRRGGNELALVRLLVLGSLLARLVRVGISGVIGALLGRLLLGAGELAEATNLKARQDGRSLGDELATSWRRCPSNCQPNAVRRDAFF